MKPDSPKRAPSRRPRNPRRDRRTLERRAEAKAAQLAREVLGISTLEARGSDRLDFHEVGVVTIRAALLEAFLAGARVSG